MVFVTKFDISFRFRNKQLSRFRLGLKWAPMYYCNYSRNIILHITKVGIPNTLATIRSVIVVLLHHPPFFLSFLRHPPDRIDREKKGKTNTTKVASVCFPWRNSFVVVVVAVGSIVPPFSHFLVFFIYRARQNLTTAWESGRQRNNSSSRLASTR